MKTFTEKTFIELIQDYALWDREVLVEELDSDSRPGPDRYDDEGEPLEQEWVGFTFGHAFATHTLKSDPSVKIISTQGWSYDDHEPDTFEASAEHLDSPWQFEGFQVLDEHGDPLEVYDIVNLIETEAEESFELYEHDFSEIFDSIETEEEVEPEDDNIKAWTVVRDNKPNLMFNGVCIGAASSYNYSTNNISWVELRLFKTKGGRYVCEEVHQSRWVGSRTRYRGEACNNLDEVTEFFGHGWLSKELYEDADIGAHATVNVD